MHRNGFLVAVLAMVLVLPARALAEGGTYEAKFAGQSGYPTLESGETVSSYFLATNVGPGTWDRSFVNLGTTNPRDRLSAFAIPGDWRNAARATPLDQQTVLSGGTGSFTFNMRGPEVNATTVFREYFAPVADGFAWMENNAENWPPNGVFLDYTVVPRRPPTARFSSSPSSVSQGQAIPVAVEAADNVRINRVTFSIDGTERAADDSAPYEASLPSGELAPGRHLIEARAFDGAGQQATASSAIEVADASRGFANGDPSAASARFLASFNSKGSTRRTVGYGKAAILRGRLLTEDGRPIKSANVQVSTRILVGARSFRDIIGAKVITGADGGFAYRVPPGASRQIRLAYRAFSRDGTFAAQRLFTLRTRAGVRLKVTPSSTRNGREVRFSGNLRGGPKPRAGVLVALQARQAGSGWRTFRTARARRGRFAARYRFTRTRRATGFQFRAIVRKQIGYPYSTGSSPARRVFVRP